VGMVIYGRAYRLSSVTRGENGITGIQRPEVLAEPWAFYLFVTASFLVVTLVLLVVSRSPFGAGLRGVRDSESRMRSLGYYVPASACGSRSRAHRARSEEHTSELQSRENLVCRPLLENK